MKRLFNLLRSCFCGADDHVCDKLTPQLWTKIFTKLPPDSLSQCLFVCKSWSRLITTAAAADRQENLLLVQSGNRTTTTEHSTNFTHVANTIATKPPTTAAAADCKNLLFIPSGDRTTRTEHSSNYHDITLHSASLVLPKAKSSSSSYTVVGACNGLVCVSDRTSPGTRSFTLWNPLIRKSLTLPSLQGFDPSGRIELTGFGISSIDSDDFKVLTMTSSSKSKNVPLIAYLYSLRTSSWKTIMPSKTAPNYYELIPNQTMAFARGAIHCIARMTSKEGGEQRNLVLAFDLVKEEFSEIVLPRCLMKVPAENLKVKAIQSSIAVVAKGRVRGEPPEGITSEIVLPRCLMKVPAEKQRVKAIQSSIAEIWVMKQKVCGEAEPWEKAIDSESTNREMFCSDEDQPRMLANFLLQRARTELGIARQRKGYQIQIQIPPSAAPPSRAVARRAPLMLDLGKNLVSAVGWFAKLLMEGVSICVEGFFGSLCDNYDALFLGSFVGWMGDLNSTFVPVEILENRGEIF